MTSTPKLPDWIKEFRAPGFTNIWELVPWMDRLYGTETLYGDWDAPVLVLLQDFSTHDIIAARLAAGEADPYYHDPRIQTNIRLQQLVGPYTRSADPRTCGVLYGSALVGLLKHGDGLGASYKTSPAVQEYCREVLNWTVQEMPQLRSIACMGTEAQRTVTQANIASTAIYHFPHPSPRAQSRWTPAVLQNWEELWNGMKTRKSADRKPALIAPPQRTSAGGEMLAQRPKTTSPHRSVPMSSRNEVLEGILRLNPSTDTTYPAFIHDTRTERPGRIIGILWDCTTHGDGATLEEMFHRVREEGLPGWTQVSHWDGPDTREGQRPNGIGILRKWGDLHFTAATRQWRLHLR